MKIPEARIRTPRFPKSNKGANRRLGNYQTLEERVKIDSDVCAFSLAAACGAFVWIAANGRHELGEQTRCARSCVPRQGDATRGGLFSRLAAPDRLGTVAVRDTDPA
jgi:hypothetical protein